MAFQVNTQPSLGDDQGTNKDLVMNLACLILALRWMQRAKRTKTS
jgi:hypothetical protein